MSKSSWTFGWQVHIYFSLLSLPSSCGRIKGEEWGRPWLAIKDNKFQKPNFTMGFQGGATKSTMSWMSGSWRGFTKDHHPRTPSARAFIISRREPPACWGCVSKTKTNGEWWPPRKACRLFYITKGTLQGAWSFSLGLTYTSGSLICRFLSG